MDNMNPSQVSVPYVNSVESTSYHNHIKYPLRQISSYKFDKSTLRHISKMPRMNSIPAVRIAPPEPIRTNLMNDRYMNNHNDRCSEEIKNDHYFQAVKDRRKRNYAQEETDRIDSTPKKSRRNDLKNVMSHYKRSHDDSSQDSLDDTNPKKLCSDSDRSIAKMMSYTSSISVIAKNFTWNNHSKKRKSSKIEKSKNESPEKVEKLRKIATEDTHSELHQIYEEQIPENATYVVKQHIPGQVHDHIESQVVDEDQNDGRPFSEPPLPDDDGEYVKVAGGKILNRTNRTYRKKLNTSKINPESIISIEPELVNGSSKEDEDSMKENLLKMLMDNIERGGEKDERVIFYENSIVEEIAKNQNKIDSAKSEISNDTSTVDGPISSTTAPQSVPQSVPTFNSAIMSTPLVQSQPPTEPIDQSKNPLLANASKISTPDFNCSLGANPLLKFNSSSNNLTNNSPSNANSTSVTFNFNNNSQTLNTSAFSSSKTEIDKINSTSESNSVKPNQVTETITATVANNANNSAPITATPSQTNETPAMGSPKNNFLFPAAASMIASSSDGITSSVASSSMSPIVSSQQQNSCVGVTGGATQPTTLQFGSTSFVTNAATSNGNNVTTNSVNFSNTPLQFNNKFNTNQNKTTESNGNPLSQITMFGNTSMSAAATSSPASVSHTLTTTGSSFATATSNIGGGFQFGQNTVSSSSNATGFSFGGATKPAENGFKLGASTVTVTSTGPTFSVPSFTLNTNNTNTMNATSTLTFNTTSTPSFSSNSTSAFNGLKFGSGSTPSFGSSSFDTANKTNSFASPSLPTFGSSQNNGFMNNNGFGNTTSQSQTQPVAPAFGSVASSQTNPTFGSQTNPTFGSNQPNAFGNTPLFESGDSSNVFKQTPAVPQFGASNSQFGSSGAFTFGSNTTNPPAFGSAQPSGAFGGNGVATPAASTFNFNSASSTFGAVAPAKPADNAFRFPAPVAQPQSNPGFAFGAGVQTQPTQPFAFAAAPSGPTTFSIGAGGSSTRRARPRRKC